MINFVALKTGHIFRRSYDYNNFAPLEEKLYEQYPQYKEVNTYFTSGGK